MHAGGIRPFLLQDTMGIEDNPNTLFRLLMEAPGHDPPENTHRLISIWTQLRLFELSDVVNSDNEYITWAKLSEQRPNTVAIQANFAWLITALQNRYGSKPPTPKSPDQATPIPVPHPPVWNQALAPPPPKGSDEPDGPPPLPIDLLHLKGIIQWLKFDEQHNPHPLTTALAARLPQWNALRTATTHDPANIASPAIAFNSALFALAATPAFEGAGIWSPAAAIVDCAATPASAGPSQD
jgi:hypothetical protein